MSKTLLEHVAGKPAAVRVDADWISKNCKKDFDAKYWETITKQYKKAKRECPQIALQVGAGTPRQGSIRQLLAHGSVQVVKVGKGAAGGVFPVTTGITDHRSRAFVDLLYMLDGLQPGWELFAPFPLRWAGADKEYPYFAAKFVADHVARSIDHASGKVGQRVATFNDEGIALPEHLHFVIPDNLLQQLHESVKNAQATYKAALDELAQRTIRNKGHQINRVWMVSQMQLNVLEFTRNAAPPPTYTPPAGPVKQYIVFQLQQCEGTYYLYHLAHAQRRHAPNLTWPWRRKELTIKKHGRITLYVEYQRPP